MGWARRPLCRPPFRKRGGLEKRRFWTDTAFMGRKTVSGLLLAVFLVVSVSVCLEEASGLTTLSSAKSSTFRDILALSDPSIEKIEAAGALQKKAFRIFSSQNSRSYLFLVQGISVGWVGEKPLFAGKAPQIYILYRVFLI